MTFIERLGLEHPIVQAGMGGGVAAGELAGAVSAAGGLGTVGILAPAGFEQELRRARDLAEGRPIAANLLVPFTREGHVRVCRDMRSPVVTLHGGFDRTLVRELKDGGALVLQTVGTPEHARRARADGADGVVVQGVEAGGHLVGVEQALDALPRVQREAKGMTVLLAGGIADHSDVQRALDAGADAVVAGTRFLLTDECRAHPAYKQRVLDADRTIQTRLFGLGWPMPHRVVPNAATERWCHRNELGPRAVLALQPLTRPLQRLPMSLANAMVRTQHPAVPLLGPAAALEGLPDRYVDATPLYAGETALRIDSVLPAAEALALLAGP